MVAAVGIVGLIAGRLLNRRLYCSSDEALVCSYRIRFFLRVVFAQSAALVGFALSIAPGLWWVYLLGLGFSAQLSACFSSFQLAAASRPNRMNSPRTAATARSAGALSPQPIAAGC